MSGLSFAEYDTDKGDHSYLETYRELFTEKRFDIKMVLELGIFRGGSLRAWRDWFPFAQIVGYDIDPGTMIYGEERITTYTGDVRSANGLRQVVSFDSYDLIVDDASHRPIDQFHALQVLWPSLRIGGVYVIEDLDLHRHGSEILATFHLLVRGECKVTLHLGDKQADDLLILEKT